MENIHFKVPTHALTTDGWVEIVTLSNDVIALTINELRNQGYISYTAWRKAGQDLMSAPHTDEAFDNWVQTKATVGIDALEAELVRRAEQPVASHGTKLSLVK